MGNNRAGEKKMWVKERFMKDEVTSSLGGIKNVMLSAYCVKTLST